MARANLTPSGSPVLGVPPIRPLTKIDHLSALPNELFPLILRHVHPHVLHADLHLLSRHIRTTACSLTDDHPTFALENLLHHPPPASVAVAARAHPRDQQQQTQQQQVAVGALQWHRLSPRYHRARLLLSGQLTLEQVGELTSLRFRPRSFLPRFPNLFSFLPPLRTLGSRTRVERFEEERGRMAALTAVLRGLVEEHVALGRKNDAPWRFDPHAEDDLAFMWASYVGGKNGDDEAVVRFYLADEKTSRSSVQQAMVMSAGGGNVRCFDLLRKSVAERESAGEDELGECLGMALRFAAREGRPQMVALILDLLVDLGEIAPDNDSTAHPQPHIGLLTPTLLRLSLASPDVVRVLLTRTPLRPDVETFVAACLKGFTPTVALMLDSDPRLASAQDSRALRVACSSGHADIAALLIRSSSKCDPSARDDEAVRYACNNGHVDVVRLLLADGRVDPRARNDECLARALANGHEDVVSLLRGCGCRVGIGSSMAYFGRRVSTEVGGMWRGWKFASLHASSSGLVTAAVANRVVRAGVVEGWNHAGEAMWWFLYPVMVLLVWALCSLALRH